jgi:hypothetical protein
MHTQNRKYLSRDRLSNEGRSFGFVFIFLAPRTQQETNKKKYYSKDIKVVVVHGSLFRRHIK